MSETKATNFWSIYTHGMVRVAACSIPIALGKPRENAHRIAEAATQLGKEHVALAAFGELSLTGATLGDLYTHDALLDDTVAALKDLIDASRDFSPIVVVGAPLTCGGQVFNCALAIHDGELRAAVPQSFPAFGTPFMPFANTDAIEPLDAFPQGPALLLDSIVSVTTIPGFSFSMIVGRDANAIFGDRGTPNILRSTAALIHLASDVVTVGSSDLIRARTTAVAAEFGCAYIYTSTGEGESTTDTVRSGQAIVAEAGRILAELPPLHEGAGSAIADIDLDVLRAARRSPDVVTAASDSPFSTLMVCDDDGLTVDLLNEPTGLRRPVARFPFITDGDLDTTCAEAYAIQTRALTQRLAAIGNPKLVLGVSGGLDSTHALLVAAKAMDTLGRPRTDILTYTMPGFATSAATKSNATRLAEAIGASFEEIDIRPAAQQMLADMHHPFAAGEAVYDVTFENVQAGLRADYLFRLANRHGGIVLGTGDLSEASLGWCTFGVGDHISHYNVNPGIPKTLMQHLIRWTISRGDFGDDVNSVLQAILDTEISPELIPVEEGEEIQSTQDTIGPYELHDFTLFHTLRYGMRPSKIAFLAAHAWGDASEGEWPEGFPTQGRHEYSLADIVKWEREFFRRFFSNQFKRSTSVDGPLVIAGGSLSPRGAWAMPSDVSSAVWLAELDTIAEM